MPTPRLQSLELHYVGCGSLLRARWWWCNVEDYWWHSQSLELHYPSCCVIARARTVGKLCLSKLGYAIALGLYLLPFQHEEIESNFSITLRDRHEGLETPRAPRAPRGPALFIVEVVVVFVGLLLRWPAEWQCRSGCLLAVVWCSTMPTPRPQSLELHHARCGSLL
jgi:hypothetical protein